MRTVLTIALLRFFRRSTVGRYTVRRPRDLHDDARSPYGMQLKTPDGRVVIEYVTKKPPSECR